MQNSRSLALCHYWVAFGTFLPAVLLGAWQMLMRSPLPAPLDDPDAYYASVTLHGTAMAYVVTTFFAMGFGYAIAATSLGRPVRGVAAAWIGFVICLDRHGDGGRDGARRQGIGALHLLPAAPGEPLVLPRRVPADRRIDDLGRADGRQHDRLEARQSRPPGAARDVRDHRDGAAVGVGGVRRPDRARGHIAAAGLRLERSDRRRPRPHAVLGDLACHRLFLADAGLYRFLYAGGRGGGRAALQRHDGAAHLHHVPGLLAAGRHAPSPGRPGARLGLQVPAILPHLPGRAADAAHRVLDLRQLWRSPAVIAAAAGFSGGSERCPGTSRWCWRSACRW